MNTTLSPFEILGILVHHIGPVFRWRTAGFLARWAIRLPRYRARFIDSTDDAALAECKRTFLPLAALHHELVEHLGIARAQPLSQAVALDVATTLQRRCYLGENRTERTWKTFHAEHERQMRSGLLRHNQHSPFVVVPGRVEFQITRCRFFEAMRSMGIGSLTEAFCRSDEIVFNEYLPGMRFHRGEVVPNTIARGGTSCGFVFEDSSRAV
jgi:hypothetical protein